MTPGQPFEAFLDALVDVEKSQLEVQHRLSGHAKPKVTGLDHAGVDRPHGNLEHAFAGHGPEWMEIALDARQHSFIRKILSQRPGTVGPVVVERHARRIWMPDRYESEEVHHLSFEPVGGGILCR